MDGERWGDYELLEPIGRGAMGTVFKARHMRLNRLVALKRISHGRGASEHERKRFLREAEAVARLQHPHIVTLYEAGEAEGQPYLAMEYVPGGTLAETIGERPLPPRLAVACVKKISEAVHYAHEHGVLHRDLKPSNIALDRNREPRVMDFGLARLVEQDSEMTLSGMAIGSPSYMAPEQAAGNVREVSAASDVYSLGAILYEALTAHPPFQADSSVETMRQVVEQDPVSPRLLNASVPRDLETICLKCLEKELHRRYATARALAEDLDRFLRDEPICARATRPAEKAWRWCRRNRALAASAGIGVALVLTVAIGSPIAALRINRERQAAAIEASKSRQVAAFLAGMLKSVQPEVAKGRDTALLRDMLDQTAKRLDTEFADQPEVEAQLRLVVARAYLSLQLGEEGAKHARIAWRLRSQLLGATHPDALDAGILLAALLENTDKWKEAKAIASDALQHCRRQFGNRDPRTCRALHVLGNALKRGSEYPAAIAALREVVEFQRSTPGYKSEEKFSAVEALGCALIEGGQPGEAVVVLETWLRELPLASQTNSVDAAFAKGWLGTALQRQDRFVPADVLQRESLELKRRLLPPDHPAIGWHLFYWAQAFAARGNFLELQPLLTEAWTIAERHPAESLHLKHMLALYGRDWMRTCARTEPSAVGFAATWQERLAELERQHPELKGKTK